MDRLLVVCPSRGRPNRLKNLISSFERTTGSKTDLIVLLDSDDKSLSEYMDVIGIHRCVVQKRMTLTEIINSAFIMFPDYAYYCVCNDDMEFITNKWDDYLRSDGIAYGNFRVLNFNPMSSVINGDIVRAVGWLQYPGLISLSGDNIWMWIGKRLGKLYRYWDVFIDHNHPYFEKHEWDETYDESNSNERYEIDWSEVMYWLKNKSDDCIKDIRRKVYDR